MWDKEWRNRTWAEIETPWDLIVIGGGITGAGILREAARLGIRTLLLEQRDFAWGTSSRSSKLVHGGLRYLKQGQVGMTCASVREREQLLSAAPGLIRPLGFLWASYEGDRPRRWVLALGLIFYDILGGRSAHRHYGAFDFRMLVPYIERSQLRGGYAYGDAQTDDARLVLRLLQEAAADGACALNYARVESLLPTSKNERNTVQYVSGVEVRDRLTGRCASAYAPVVINATGAWADRLRQQVGSAPRLRPLRGSHLIFPAWRLPVAQAVSFSHPMDGRPVFIVPWEGVVLVGTTDTDHRQPLDAEPRISPVETAYLLAAVEAHFPALGIGPDDILCTFAGVRPVVGTGARDPSRESREHVVWEENGLLTVTGGKLTTFRLVARDALAAASNRLPTKALPPERAPALTPSHGPLPGAEALPEEAQKRLWGRYGTHAPQLVSIARPDELRNISHTPYLWAELRWAARAEAVAYLDDLLLRRTRLGLILPEGGTGLLEAIRAVVQGELRWDDERWEAEVVAYRAIWQRNYSAPARHELPDFHMMLQEAMERKRTRRLSLSKLAPTAILLLLAIWLVRLWRQKMAD